MKNEAPRGSFLNEILKRPCFIRIPKSVDFRPRKYNRSFTLVELILVIAVILILAAIAIPNFYKTKQRAIEKEGIVNIKLIAAAERIYRMEYNTYRDCADASECNDRLKLMLNATNWAYGADSSGNISATSQASTGMSCTYALSPAGYDGAPSSSGCP